ncbi:MAG: glycoside hydrolase family 2 protein, partial [Clostridiales Family XIII bacterium]|nr:glycoside hydrolase family 2 protein [Clostridiales Family XIII bacterium]
MASSLLRHGKIADPYLRDNESKALPEFEKDYVFQRDFELPADALAHDRTLSHCAGLDTIADAALNGVAIAGVDNMHRTCAFDVKSRLRTGGNTVTLTFYSPVKYLADHPPIIGKPYASIRKASCMFGWD